MDSDTQAFSVGAICLTVFAVLALSMFTSCEKARYQAFVDGGYVEQIQPGSSDARWVKPNCEVK